MRITKTLLLAAAISCASGVSHADQSLPERGMSKKQVEAAYGSPDSRSNAVGNPPISRWKYADFTVYFEGNYTLHSVKHKSQPAEATAADPAPASPVSVAEPVQESTSPSTDQPTSSPATEAPAETRSADTSGLVFDPVTGSFVKPDAESTPSDTASGSDSESGTATAPGSEVEAEPTTTPDQGTDSESEEENTGGFALDWGDENANTAASGAASPSEAPAASPRDTESKVDADTRKTAKPADTPADTSTTSDSAPRADDAASEGGFRFDPLTGSFVTDDAAAQDTDSTPSESTTETSAEQQPSDTPAPTDAETDAEDRTDTVAPAAAEPRQAEPTPKAETPKQPEPAPAPEKPRTTEAADKPKAPAETKPEKREERTASGEKDKASPVDVIETGTEEEFVTEEGQKVKIPKIKPTPATQGSEASGGGSFRFDPITGRIIIEE